MKSLGSSSLNPDKLPAIASHLVLVVIAFSCSFLNPLRPRVLRQALCLSALAVLAVAQRVLPSFENPIKHQRLSNPDWHHHP